MRAMMARDSVRASRGERIVDVATTNAAITKKPITMMSLGGVDVVRIGSGEM